MAGTMWIRYGGSNRKLTEHKRILVDRFGDSFRPMGSAALGIHWSNQHGIIPDTPENRQWVRDIKGITIQRRS